jgi:hypothetical protein
MEEEKKEVVETTEKKGTEKKKPHIIVRIFNIILWLVLFGWMAICIIDYFNVANENEPQFCIKNETKNLEDGTVYICRGAGYVAYRYESKSSVKYKFGPFWTKDEYLD